MVMPITFNTSILHVCLCTFIIHLNIIKVANLGVVFLSGNLIGAQVILVECPNIYFLSIKCYFFIRGSVGGVPCANDPL